MQDEILIFKESNEYKMLLDMAPVLFKTEKGIDLNSLPDSIISFLKKIADTVISVDGNAKILTNETRQLGAVLYLIILIIDVVNTYLLGKPSTDISSMTEGDVSIAYNSKTYPNLNENYLSSPGFQPFGIMLLNILKQTQPFCHRKIGRFPMQYYRGI